MGDASIDLPERRANRPVTIAHRIEYVIVLGVFALLRLLSIDAASAFTGKLLRWLGPLIRPVSKRGEENLAMIFPDWSRAKIQSVIRDVWENIGRTGGEYAHLDKLTCDGEKPRIEIVGREGVAEIIEQHGRAVFVTGHFANWEVSGIGAHQQGLPFAFVYRAQNNPLIDELLIKERGRVMTRRQIPKGVAGARPLIDALKDNFSLAFLADQKLNTGGIEVPFMGHPAMTAPAAARIAVRFNLPVIPSVVERLDGAYFRITNFEPIAYETTGNLAGDVEALTIKINQFLEREIRARPEQWLWHHRRWRIKRAS